MDMIDWVATGLDGVAIKRGEAPSRVVVTFASPLPPAVAGQLSALGFRPDANGKSMVRQGGSFQFNEMRRAFPGLYKTKAGVEDTWIRAAPAATPSVLQTQAPTRPGASRPGVPFRPGVSPQATPARPQAPAAQPVVAPSRPGAPLRPAAQPSPVTPAAPSRPVPVREATPSKPAVVEGRAPEPRHDVSQAIKRATIKPRRRGERVAMFQAEPTAGAGDRVNQYQERYKPGSRLGKPIATIPVNLAAATKAALERVRFDYGDIDGFVAKRLHWTIEELASFLSPEQIDAVALALAAADRGQGFLLADQTGLGKGRVVAAIARAIVLSGQPAIVLTEKENLFSDLYRDIADIGSLDLFGAPFILNDGGAIVDTSTGDLLFQPMKKSEVADAIKAKKLPKNVRLCLATYSQFNRQGSPKAEFLKAIARKRPIVCDESHNAVGDSNTSEVVGAAMDVASSVTYSSATFARNAKNLAAYRRLFPPSMQSSDLEGLLTAGGQAISEAVSQMLAEDGANLRREHDLSEIRIDVSDDETRLDRNRAYADELSPILARIAKISRHVALLAEEKNGGKQDDLPQARAKKASKDFWYTGNFGARLSVIVRQFVTALLVDLAVERAVAALDEGDKPVIVVEQTMESLMRELAEDDGVERLASGEAIEGQQDAVPDAAQEAAAAAEVAEARPPQFRDALRLLLERSMQLIVRRPGVEEPERIPVDVPELVAEAELILAEIENFPELSLSPIDDVRDRIEQIGRERAAAGIIAKPWVAEEVSARGMRVVDGKYVAYPPQERVKLVAAFNAGLYDAFVLTRAASTGLSLHSSEKAKDQRRRRMIELQIPSNVVERVQFWGRVNRRGQVNSPLFETLSTALPLQTRQLALQNRKVADLSANVTASAESALAMDVPDMLDIVGNEVCRRILEERPSLPDRMQIAMKLPDPDKAEAELYHVNKFLQRLVLLPADEQDALYAEAISSYEAVVRDLAARGRNPRGARELEGAWRVVDSDVFEAGVARDGGVFGRPVTVTTIEAERELNPLGTADIQAALVKSRARLSSIRGAEANNPFAAAIDHIRREKPLAQQAALHGYLISIRQALADSKPNAVKAAGERIDSLARLLLEVRPGCDIQVPSDEGLESGMIIDVIEPAKPEDYRHQGRWTIRYVVPGDERPRELSAAAIIRDSSIHITGSGEVNPNMMKRFDRVPRGLSKIRRKILDGNLARAVIASRNAGWGSPVTWRDEAGAPRRAILVPKSRQNSIDSLPGRTVDPSVALHLISEGAQLWTNPDDHEASAQIVPDGRVVRMVVPGSKRLAKVYETPEVLAIVKSFRGDHRVKDAEVPMERVGDLIEALARDGHAFHYDGVHRRKVSAFVRPMDVPEPEMEMAQGMRL